MNYLPILVFLGVAAGLGLVLILAAIIVAVRNPDSEKTSAYECGFNAFDDARMKFDVRSVSYTHLRAHETKANLVCRLLLEKKKKNKNN